MSDVGCRMSDVGCRMSDVGCRMSDKFFGLQSYCNPFLFYIEANILLSLYIFYLKPSFVSDIRHQESEIPPKSEIRHINLFSY